MRIFKTFNKINFIDERDVFVGYSMECLCSDIFGWYILDEIKPKGEYVEEKDDYNFFISHKEEDKICETTEYDGYFFDTSFFEEHKEHSMIVFKLKKKGEKDLYLHFYNFHNGYYMHEYFSRQGSENWLKGEI